VFFTAAFFYDAGFAVYFFLFNLYLFDCGFSDRTIGWIGGAMTFGSLVGTLPASAPVRKFGVRPVLIALFISAPLVNAARALWMWEPAQIGLAFLTGLVMCVWGVCFLPAVARLTSKKNSAFGFSLIFSVSVGTSILGGIVCGYLRQWLDAAGIVLQPFEVKRLILIGSCVIVFIGILPVLRLHIPAASEEDAGLSRPAPGMRSWNLHPFLRRFLPTMALWSAVLAAFTPFANIYLTRNLHIPMASIGLMFAAAQFLQFCMGLVAPFVFRTSGLVNGIVISQTGAALLLGLLAGARSGRLAVAIYLTFSAVQWISSPGLYNLLMNEVPDAERSSAASMTMFCNALCGSIATAAAGMLYTRFGYPRVLLGLAAIALCISFLFRILIPAERREPAPVQVNA
jgi:predicted MFS family arabinose efflux permease